MSSRIGSWRAIMTPGILVASLGLMAQGSCWSNPVVEATSHCTVSGNAAFNALNLTAHQNGPFCPVKLKYPYQNGIEPQINFSIDLWDNTGSRSLNDGVRIRIMNAAKAPIAETFAFFSFTPRGQTPGLLAAGESISYTPGMSGYYPPTFTRDSAFIKFEPAIGTSTAALWFLLNYVPETAATLGGPNSMTYGETPQFTAGATMVRRPATVVWKVDGAVVRNATIGWYTEWDYFIPVFATTGTHILRIEVTSGTNTLSAAQKGVIVNMPTGCPGGGGPPVPVRAAPAESAGSGNQPIAQSTPAFNKCPPS